MLRIKITQTSKKKNLCVESVLRVRLGEGRRLVRIMALILSNSNANFAVQSLNGSAGEILIFASLVIKSSVLAIIFLGKRKKSCHNAQERRSVI